MRLIGELKYQRIVIKIIKHLRHAQISALFVGTLGRHWRVCGVGETAGYGYSSICGL